MIRIALRADPLSVARATMSGMGLEKDPARVVDELWARIAAHDWARAANLLAEDVSVEWPASGELITGRRNFIAVQSEYPEGWSIELLQILAQGESVVSEVEVPHETFGTFRAASFWTVRDGLIVAGREYWTTLGGDPVPAWREPYVSRIVPS